MLPDDHPDRIHVAFDDRRLVNNAELILPATLALHLGQVLCFKHKRRVARDNTVKFQRHTLQLMPDRQRRSYAGAVVVVLQGLDGRLSLQHEGRIISAQEAPPSPGSLRNGIKPSSGPASLQSAKASVRLGKRSPSH